MDMIKLIMDFQDGVGINVQAYQSE